MSAHAPGWALRHARARSTRLHSSETADLIQPPCPEQLPAVQTLPDAATFNVSKYVHQRRFGPQLPCLFVDYESHRPCGVCGGERSVYFWSGREDVGARTRLWMKKLNVVFDRAKVADGHPHRLRDMFAVELLKARVPIERVSILLGHSSIRITEGTTTHG